jgi:hypothetical protein
MSNARDMTLDQYRGAVRDLLHEQHMDHVRSGDADALARVRARHPDIAAKADEAARAAWRDLDGRRAAAWVAMDKAEADLRDAQGQPSQLLRDRAAERLAEAVDLHDTLTVESEAALAALPKEA